MRDFFHKPAGQIFAFALIALGVGLAVWMIYGAFGPSELSKLSRDRIYIDASTGKPFEYVVKIGDKTPVSAPSGGKTGYPAELCYWTKDGKAKPDPTPVLLNVLAGKPGPTFCPDCGRLVVGHNPVPAPGVTPPPTHEEYAKIAEKTAAD